MKFIMLTKGRTAIVDDEDYSYLNQWSWYCNSYGYAVRDIGGRKDRKCVFMHRLINNTPKGYMTDHINRDTLDNRKENLRTVSGRQNGINRGLNKNNTSGFKGVIWRKDIQKWQSRIKYNYKNIYLGCFENILDAVNARKNAEYKYYNLRGM